MTRGYDCYTARVQVRIELRGKEVGCMIVERGDRFIEQLRFAPRGQQVHQCRPPALALREFVYGRGGKLAKLERFQCEPDAKRLGC